MSLLGDILRVVSQRFRPRSASGDHSSTPSAQAPQRVQGRYDSAQDTAENAPHWSMADGLSANAANSPAVRKKLRDRSRYECANNSYAMGLLRTLANDLIGSGPRLAVTIPNTDAATARIIETAFAQWSAAIQIAGKLRVLEKARRRDGEGFACLFHNPTVAGPVKLDLRCVEAEQVTDYYPDITDPRWVDGVELDDLGNVIAYRILRHHPGSSNWSAEWTWDRWDAALVLHWYTCDRPGQYRGIPEFTACLPLFAQLRRYTLATLTAAETAANFAGVIRTNLPPESGAPVAVAAMDQVPMTRGMLLTMPEGWTAEQFAANQPASGYDSFKRELLNECGRAMNAPLNVVTGNSSGYNYSSGRLDHQLYHSALAVDREEIAATTLSKILRAWIEEAAISGVLPERLPPLHTWSVAWHWDGFPEVDPSGAALAMQRLFGMNMTTLKEEYARYGQDWETQVRQRAREMDLLRKLKLEVSLDAGSGQTGEALEQQIDEGNAA